ncbi:Pkinase-domain-containing protein [Hortaea werneckii]|nr:Pkinase-domain-containing protein [Hortaea werneckii]KAI7097278.1 Pkinase-domain-containing protein [Hortaea werneckii]KAI7217119.1 Pkinase-domain-containing protein [Hortaea werneckii]KAI7303689.1 Pkinase-domain-containing protein [Hortaea werneckii]KAI7369934.1 Pkinase-domain-containing protein [Hortaea werneckii]
MSQGWRPNSAVPPSNEEPSQLTQQCTQGAMDPRRLGRNNSGLTEEDISDVLCILHPCSPAAFKIVANTAERTPFNVLQNNGYNDYEDGLTQAALEEQETFILNHDGGSSQAMDLALRFSADIVNPTLGFVFGRNMRICDIVLATDSYKRVSNMHFSIFINESGVLMLRDMSTNGTMVDDMLLKGKNALGQQTRMLSPGSIIQILSPKPEEVVKFIVRIPSREGHLQEYSEKLERYMRRVDEAEVAAARGGEHAKRLAAPNPKTPNAGSYRAPIMQNQHGIHWSGGEKYNVVGLIGTGAFATVFQLATKAEGNLVAAKELEKRRFMKNGVLDRKLDNELQIMKDISHPNIVQYIDYHDHADHLYIIMEFVPCGDLQHYLGQYGPLSEDLGKKMAAQVLDSLSYLHTKKITHRDIKPDNILLADLDPDRFIVKLSDFGLSKVVPDNDTFLKTFCGTLLYCAPEVFPHYDAHVSGIGRGQKRPRKGGPQAPATKFHSYSQSVDIWSFGAVLWFSLCCRPPFEGVADNTGRGMFEKIMMTPLDSTDLINQGVGDEAVALLVDMLNTDPATRPSPAACLRHEWFVGRGVTQPAGPGSPELALKVIAEEDEADDHAQHQAPDLSQLSLQEQAQQGHLLGPNSGRSHDSHYDEVSFNSGSMRFFDPGQSKRFKSEAFAERLQREEQDMESSPELFHLSMGGAQNGNDASQRDSSSSSGQPRRLFGEISPAALNAGGLGMQASAGNLHTDPGNNSANASRGPSNDNLLQANHAQRLAALSAMASPSLLGAESLLRDVHMHSPAHSADSRSVESDGPITPHTPDECRPFSAGQQSNVTPQIREHDDVTPKQPQQQRAFNRQIQIPMPPSFFFDPNDESTHTLEYASRVSGHNYLADPSFTNAKETSLPATASAETTDRDGEAQASHDEHHGDTDAEPDEPAPAPTDTEFVKPAPRLGRVTSTPDSFTPIRLDLTDRISSWGRDTQNTHIFPDRHETRIAKRNLVLWFHAKGIEKLPEHADWTKLPDLFCGIHTESSLGIAVNGVPLQKSAPIERGGELHWGRIFTGDEIEIFRDVHGVKPGLKFSCEFFHGEARGRRPEALRPFRVVHENAPNRSGGGSGGSGEQKAGMNEKRSGRREEGHVVLTGKMAAA